MQNMERGERGGAVLDGADDSGAEEGGVIDAAIKTHTEDNQAVDEQGGDENLNGGGEAPQVGEEGQAEEGTVLPEGEGAEVQSEKTDAVAEIQQFKADIMKTLEEKLKPAPEPAKPLTEEDWAHQEQEWGVPRQAIQKQINLAIRVKNEVLEAMESRFAKYELGETIQDFSKTPGYADASRYKKEITEFLKDYDTKHWNNPILLQKAVVYGRGMNAKTNLDKVRNEGERNKKIAGVARPSAPGAGARRPSAPALNGVQKEVAAMMGGESEYNKFRTRPTRTIE